MNFAATQSGHILRFGEFGAEVLTLPDARRLEDVFQALIFENQGDLREAELRRAAISLTGAIMAAQNIHAAPSVCHTMH